MKIETLDHLIEARANRRAVTVPNSVCWEGPIPAAFMMNCTGEILHRLMKQGMFVYEKKKEAVSKS